MIMHFGERLKKDRLEKNMNVFSLSQASGIRESTIYSIEKGDRPASDDNLHKLAEALGRGYEELKAWQILGKATKPEMEYILRQLLMPEPIWKMLEDVRMKRVLNKMGVDPEYKQQIFDTIPENRE